MTASGEPFEARRSRDFIVRNVDLPAERFAERLLDELALWSGRRVAFDDDVTLVVVDVC